MSTRTIVSAARPADILIALRAERVVKLGWNMFRAAGGRRERETEEESRV